MDPHHSDPMTPKGQEDPGGGGTPGGRQVTAPSEKGEKLIQVCVQIRAQSRKDRSESRSESGLKADCSICSSAGADLV